VCWEEELDAGLGSCELEDAGPGSISPDMEEDAAAWSFDQEEDDAG